MSYIHDQLLALGVERSVVFAAQAMNPERFPFPRLYILPSQVEISRWSPNDRLFLPRFDTLWRPLVSAENVAALHVHDGRIAPSFLPLARHCGIPIVTTFLGRDVTADLDNAEYLNALRLLFSQGHLFTVMSHDMARQVQRLGCPKEKLRVLHHGVRLSRFPFISRCLPKERPIVVLTIGRLIPKKGPDDLARAFALLCRMSPRVLLRVIGDGPLQAEMEAILSEAGVRNRAEFLGVLGLAEVEEQMQRAHLFCLPSRVGPDGDSEGIPNVLKEAMASGLPVVSTIRVVAQ